MLLSELNGFRLKYQYLVGFQAHLAFLLPAIQAKIVTRHLHVQDLIKVRLTILKFFLKFVLPFSNCATSSKGIDKGT